MSKKKSAATRRAEEAAAQERATVQRREMARAARRRTVRVWGIAVGVLVVVAAAGFAFVTLRDDGGPVTPPQGVVARYAVPRGDASAPVTVTVFEDFMCPHCGELEERARPFLTAQADSGSVRIRYRPIAFLSDYSTRAANAYAVVLDTSGADVAGEFHDLLFDRQPAEDSDGLSTDELVDLAVEAGATEAAVRGPIEEMAFEGWVEQATDAAADEGVEGTPTVLVDTERVDYETVDELAADLEAAVDEAGS